MAHFKCLRCRSRVWRERPAADLSSELCPGCGDALEPVANLSELVGLRSLPARSTERRRPPNRSEQVSRQIRRAIARYDAEQHRQIDPERP